jgi:tripeptide aminopeptidase
MGARDVRLTDYGAVLATIPATVTDHVPVIALLAHVDTAPQFSGTDVKPIVHRSYTGGDIALPDDPTIVLSPQQFPYLSSKVGDDIITASGTTLLGADDKAGVAIVMAAVRHLFANPSLQHGTIRIGFTPDEEIGRGVHRNLPGDLEADVAYTLDGAELGEIVYETFSADKADVHIKGVSIHPGHAKDKLVNALHLAAKIIDTLPHATLTPETTSGREGFIHVYQMKGSSAEADLHFILRDFELDGLRERGELIQQVCTAVQATEPRARITCSTSQQYRNMRYWLEHDMRPVNLGARSVSSSRHRAVLGADPWGYRWIATDGDGRADAEPVHRHAEHPRPSRVGQRSGHVPRCRGVRQADRVVGHAWQGRTRGRAIRGTPGAGRTSACRLGRLKARIP